MSDTLHAKTEHDVDIHVVAWGLTTNGWEYYITELPDSDGIGSAYVQGFENEHGTFSMDEIRPYLVSYVTVKEISTDPNSPAYLSPPEGGKWVSTSQPHGPSPENSHQH